MTAKEYFNIALVGNHNIATLRPIVFIEMLNTFAKLQCEEQAKAIADRIRLSYDIEEDFILRTANEFIINEIK